MEKCIFEIPISFTNFFFKFFSNFFERDIKFAISSKCMDFGMSQVCFTLELRDIAA
jgi:hypothetical protein